MPSFQPGLNQRERLVENSALRSKSEFSFWVDDLCLRVGNGGDPLTKRSGSGDLKVLEKPVLWQRRRAIVESWPRDITRISRSFRCCYLKSCISHFNVYAFCRWSDDLGDEINDPTRSLQLLQWWREQMVLCHQMASSQELSGEISLAHPVMIALQKTIQEFGIPLQPFVDLISAFEQDQCQTRYETFEDLLNYCERSANPVGRLVLYLGRDVSEQNVFWSDAICTGLQLANFWQDVARDYQIGRIYLPVAEMKEFGVSEETIRERVSTEAFQKLMTFQVERTRFFFEKGKPLVNHVTNDLRLDVDLFIRGGECILDKIARINYRVLETRPKVTKWDGGRLLIMALGRSLRKRFFG